MPEALGPEERVGSYRVVRPLATGGTSDLLLAKSEGPMGFERQVALKVLADRFRDDSAVSRMFVTEAAAYARLSHPAIVRLFDFFKHEDRLVMVLELVDGLTLRRLKASADGLGHSLPDAAAMHVARRVFEALACAHAAVDETGNATPIIHRDVNPSNVLVGWDGAVKIVDFGVARVTGLHAETQGGAVKGTLGYMAPEQVRGAAISPATDVYGAGIVLWELLANRRAFARGKGGDLDLLKAMADPSIPSLDELRLDLPKKVREIVARCLEIDPKNRTVTADEAARALAALDDENGGKAELSRLLAAVRDKREADKKAPSIPPRSLAEPPVDARTEPPRATDRPRPPMKRRMSGLGPGIQVVAPPKLDRLPDIPSAQSDIPSAPILEEAVDPRLAPSEPRTLALAAPPVSAPLAPIVRERPPPSEPPLPPSNELEIADNGLYVPASRSGEAPPESLELLRARAAAARTASKRPPTPTGIASWKIGLAIAIGLPLLALGAYALVGPQDGKGSPAPPTAPSAETGAPSPSAH